MADVKRHFVDGDWGQIHLRISTPSSPSAQQRPPLYCLHMSPKSGRSFQQFMQVAGNERTIVAPDYPGYGESSLPSSCTTISIADYAHSVWQVADELGHHMIDILGTHTGSKVAVKMASQRPSDCRHLVLFSAAIMTREETASFEKYFEPIPLDEEGTRFRVMWDRIIQFRGPDMTLEMMATSLAENLRGGENYELGHQAAFAYSQDFHDDLAALQHRVSIINLGDELYEATKRAAPLLQNGELIDRPEWGHGVFDVHAIDVADIVNSLLEKAVLLHQLRE